MPAPARRSKTKSLDVVTEESTASEVIAHDVIRQYNDLAPSVHRIMEADLTEAGRLHAMTMFRDSLGAVDDPMRNPLNAIVAGRLASDN